MPDKKDRPPCEGGPFLCISFRHRPACGPPQMPGLPPLARAGRCTRELPLESQKPASADGRILYFAMLVHPGLEIFVVQLDGANVVIEVLFPRDSGNEGVVAHKLNVHEPPGRQVKHGPPHHLSLADDGIVSPFPPRGVDRNWLAVRARLVPLVLRVLPASNQIVVDDAANQGQSF